jgi:uncharacterized protein YjiS (DUF1127 family)
MNTQAERLNSGRDDRVSGFTYLRKLATWMKLKREAHRIRRHENELRKILAAMSPDLLDDIGIALDADGEPVLELARENPRAVTRILGQPQPHHNPY